MITILHSFGAGMAFAFGAMFGIFLSTIIVGKGRSAMVKETKEHFDRVEKRLTEQVGVLTSMAVAMENRNKREEHARK